MRNGICKSMSIILLVVGIVTFPMICVLNALLIQENIDRSSLLYQYVNLISFLVCNMHGVIIAGIASIPMWFVTYSDEKCRERRQYKILIIYWLILVLSFAIRFVLENLYYLMQFIS